MQNYMLQRMRPDQGMARASSSRLHTAGKRRWRPLCAGCCSVSYGNGVFAVPVHREPPGEEENQVEVKMEKQSASSSFLANRSAASDSSWCGECPRCRGCVRGISRHFASCFCWRRRCVSG
jgi:hypothetical protein